MRLTRDEQTFIKQVVTRHFGSDARVRLFGSRVDDSRRGGDVDLYVEPETREGLMDRRIQCRMQLVESLPYPVDLVVNDGKRELPIYRLAREQGVAL